MGKKKRDTPSSDEDPEDELYVVEVIKAAKVHNNEWKYLVKWANYDSAEDTWEPKSNLNCPRLFKSFWDNIGIDDEDYHEGYEVQATPSWIRREKKYFTMSIGRKKSDDSSDDREAPGPSTSRITVEPPITKNKGKSQVMKKKAKVKKQVKPVKIKHKQEIDSDDSEDSDTPLSASILKGKKRAGLPVQSSDEVEDNHPPLAKSRKPRPEKPPPTRKAKRTQSERDPDSSESAGSLFSEKEPSSPETALGSLPSGAQMTTKSKVVPTKRPSADDAPSGQRKRQIIEMPMPITITVGNATKVRLAQRVTQGGPSGAPGTHPPIQKLDLSKLSFKKNVNITAATSPVVPSPAVPSPSNPPLPRRPASISDHVQSPIGHGTPTFDAAAEAAPGPQEVRRPPPLPRRILSSIPKPPLTDEPMAEASRFLSNIMPPSMASPIHDDAGADMPPPPVPNRPVQSKTMALPRIQKKWKWTGDLFMDVSRDKAEHVCQIILSDVTDPLPNGLRFSICLSSDSIRLSAFHDMTSLPMFLLASARAQQFARVGPLEDKDAEAVKQIGIFMKRKSYFSFAHLYMDEVSVALLIVYPTGHTTPVLTFKVPPDLSIDCFLQAALVPWELTTKEFRAATWKSRSPTVERTLDPGFLPVLDAAGRSVVTQRRFYQALHILGFSKTLYDFMPNRRYCVWNIPSDRTPSNRAVGYETTLLKVILSTCEAKDVGSKDDVRVVFVHVGSLQTLHALPALAERRSKRPELRFVTYGTHPSVPRERWCMREIYPLGGIVTFTPSAIIEGHYRVFDRMKKIAEHPIWDGYVLPSVVAMVAKLSCQGMHPLKVFDDGNFVYQDLLALIEHGSLALLHAPYLARDPPSTKDPASMWTHWMIRLPAMNARQILEECLKVAAEQFANTSDADLPIAIEREIVCDVLRVQIQPAIMDNYRRFVIVKGRGDKYLTDDKGGVESTTHEKFDFKDDFFEAPARETGKK